MQEHTNRLYSLQDVAGLLGGTSIWTIRAHIKRGSIGAVRLGTRVYVTAEEVTRVLRDGLPSLKSTSVENVAVSPVNTKKDTGKHERNGSSSGTEELGKE
jgi:hypothetical protein